MFWRKKFKNIKYIICKFYCSNNQISYVLNYSLFRKNNNNNSCNIYRIKYIMNQEMISRRFFKYYIRYSFFIKIYNMPPINALFSMSLSSDDWDLFFACWEKTGLYSSPLGRGIINRTPVGVFLLILIPRAAQTIRFDWNDFALLHIFQSF